MVNEAQEHGKNAADAAENYDEYAAKLATVISQLDANEQQLIFYGGLGLPKSVRAYPFAS